MFRGFFCVVPRIPSCPKLFPASSPFRSEDKLVFVIKCGNLGLGYCNTDELISILAQVSMHWSEFLFQEYVWVTLGRNGTRESAQPFKKILHPWDIFFYHRVHLGHKFLFFTERTEVCQLPGERGFNQYWLPSEWFLQSTSMFFRRWNPDALDKLILTDHQITFHYAESFGVH